MVLVGRRVSLRFLLGGVKRPILRGELLNFGRVLSFGRVLRSSASVLFCPNNQVNIARSEADAQEPKNPISKSCFFL